MRSLMHLMGKNLHPVARINVSSFGQINSMACSNIRKSQVVCLVDCNTLECLNLVFRMFFFAVVAVTTIQFSAWHLIRYHISSCHVRHPILRFGRRNRKLYKNSRCHRVSIAVHGLMMANIWHWAWRMAPYRFAIRYVDVPTEKEENQKFRNCAITFDIRLTGRR